jgi:signal transduction histidine kinase
MSVDTVDIEERWARWLVQRNQRGLRISLLVIAGFYPAFGVLDWHLAPRSALPWLWGMRALIALGALVLLPLLRRPRVSRWVEPIGVAVAWVAAGGISMMTTYIGGLASPYYAGLLIVLVGSGLLLVWRPRLVIAAHVAFVATFVVANVATGKIGPVPTALSNLTFLSVIALVAAMGQVVQFQTQREQLIQRVRLEQATSKLERAHADLQQLDQFKSRFFANMTHELRTPLALILTPLELLLQGEMDQFGEAARNSFHSMYRSALKLLKLINDLLDLSRLEESRLRLHVAEHELVAYLRALTDESQVLARRQGILLTFAASVECATVRCDLDRLERVFVNLLSNAIKFTPPHGRVDVSMSATGAGIQVVVEDDGPGFAPDQAEKIFERFYQVDMEGTREHGGAGIGLALARELVHLHGGTITASSDGRRGACFVVKLPTAHTFRPEDLASADVAEEAPESASLDWAVQLERRKEFRLLDIDEATDRRIVERDADEAQRPHTVVVVEDNPRVVQVIHMSLRRQFKVLTAPDGLRGLDVAIREQPSLVVTDLMMPGIDGLELTRRLRADPRTRHIPVLMLTARAALDDRVKGLDTGVSAYLTKPFSPRELLTCARRLVRAEEETADLVLSRRMDSVELVVAGFAHEINNPLNYVKTALLRVAVDVEHTSELAARSGTRALETKEIANLETSAARIREMLAVANAGLARIAGTVELLGRYGRGGFGRDLAPLDAWEAVRTVVDVVLPATGRRVALQLEFDGDGTLECVPDEFKQVLTNLIQNAIEAVPEGTGRVRIGGRVEAEHLVITVSDNGPGIPLDVQGRLFTPFFTTKGPGRGMGLGLTIARRVVQGLGGTLQVTSAPGSGAEFVVRVPRRQRRPQAVASPV